MKMSQAFPSRWLNTDDLCGNEVKVVIDHIEIENVGTEDKPEDKPVVYFQGKKKAWVLNITNRDTLVAALGDESDEWIGKEIVLFPSTTPFRGKPTACTRVRVPAENPGSDDGIPF